MKTLSAHVTGFYRSSFHAYTTEVMVDGHRWRLGLRYSKFHEFYSQLEAIASDFDVEFPPKGTLFFTPKPEERQEQLEVFLQKVLAYYAAKDYPTEIETLLCDLLKVPRHLKSPERDDDDISTSTESGLDEPINDTSSNSDNTGRVQKDVDEEKLVITEQVDDVMTLKFPNKDEKLSVAAPDLVQPANLVIQEPSEKTIADDGKEIEVRMSSVSEKAVTVEETIIGFQAEVAVEVPAVKEVAKKPEETIADNDAIPEDEAPAVTVEGVLNDAAIADFKAVIEAEVPALSETDVTVEETITDYEAETEVVVCVGKVEETISVYEAETDTEEPATAEEIGISEGAIADLEAETETEVFTATVETVISDSAIDDFEAETEAEVPTSLEEIGISESAITEIEAEIEADMPAALDEADILKKTAEDERDERVVAVDETKQANTECVAVRSCPKELANEIVVEKFVTVGDALDEQVKATGHNESEQQLPNEFAAMILQAPQDVGKPTASDITTIHDKVEHKKLATSFRIAAYLPKPITEFIRSRCMKATNLAILCIALLLPVVLTRR
ncbi:conserved hypothetical protein [Plasmopara halstedii]|uniref:PX domain-containing protein n=1 Tax=Plasmopara halstedii TaxID=4781 RepID=A0A0P1AZH9_PLAHL|nr:conserved hypothetical protein [Plasmopara halstedii]CEG47500.1 conserved hypothetical protein [Plasmopara halstedii]|eukprot:XP_024583869.1 conserved hypothetical protein [Plasmopara halstedii]